MAAVFSSLAGNIFGVNGMLIGLSFTLVIAGLLLLDIKPDDVILSSSTPFLLTPSPFRLGEALLSFEAAAMSAGLNDAQKADSPLRALHNRIICGLKLLLLNDGGMDRLPEPAYSVDQRDGAGSIKTAHSNAVWSCYRSAARDLSRAFDGTKPLTKTELATVMSTLVPSYRIIARQLGLDETIATSAAPMTSVSLTPGVNLTPGLASAAARIETSIAYLEHHADNLGFDDRHTLQSMRSRHIPNLLHAHARAVATPDLQLKEQVEQQTAQAFVILEHALEELRARRDDNAGMELKKAALFIEMRYPDETAMLTVGDAH